MTPEEEGGRGPGGLLPKARMTWSEVLIGPSVTERLGGPGLKAGELLEAADTDLGKASNKEEGKKLDVEGLG